jgi:hypothetical protein
MNALERYAENTDHQQGCGAALTWPGPAALHFAAQGI